MYMVFTHQSWSSQHFHMRDGVHSIFSRQTASTVFSLKRWSPKQFILRGGVHNIYSQHMESTEFTYQSWHRYFSSILVSPSSSSLVQIIYKGEEKSTALTRYGVHSIDSQDRIYTAFTLKKWSALYILMRYGFRSIYSGLSRNGSTAFKYEIWRTHYLLMKEAVHSIYTL